jgi:alpha-galactosidase
MKIPRLLPILTFAVFSSATAADLTGHWVSKVEMPDGHSQETVFILKQDGANLSGKIVVNVSRETPITEGSVNGDTVSLTTTFRAGQNQRKVVYEGKLDGDTLRLKATSATPRGPSEFAGTRGSETAGDPPPYIAPPALHPVKDNGLARTPPMGWNSWNHFAGRIDDAAVRGIADAMASNGMKAAGYLYINIDDTWEADRDSNGVLHSNKKFPDMKALADYVHGKGLKVGIYSSPGPRTCAGYEGSYAHEDQDARMYAQWGIDYLKYDWCSASRIYKDTDMQAVYQKMGEALLAAGRPIVYSLCQYGRQDVWKWGPDVGGNLWRTTGDISDSWNSMTKIGFDQSRLAEFARPGHWNDPDMLEVGNGKMTDTEYRTHMSLWSILAAPLLAGNDLRDMSKDTLDILTNREIIAVDQDSLGKQGTRTRQEGDVEVWVKPLSNGAQAAGLFNRGDREAKITITAAELGIKGKMKIRNLWTHKNETKGDEFSAMVPGHGVVMLKISR